MKALNESGLADNTVIMFLSAHGMLLPFAKTAAYHHSTRTPWIVNYPGVKHSFTNPDADATGKKFDLPLEYNADADKDSWQKNLEFFKEIFSK